MDILFNVLLALHMLGLALIIGTFVVQMRAKNGFRTDLVLGGAITQVVTGVGMVGLNEATGGDAGYVPNMTWVAIKLVLAVIVLGAAIVAVVAQKKGGKVRPWFHAAGGLAVINVLVATLLR